jgi:hypothetical protein
MVAFCSLGRKIVMLHKGVAVCTIGLVLALNSLSTGAVAHGVGVGGVCRGGVHIGGIGVNLRGGRLGRGLGNPGYGFGPRWVWWAWPGDECHAWSPCYGYRWVCYH